MLIINKVTKRIRNKMLIAYNKHSSTMQLNLILINWTEIADDKYNCAMHSDCIANDKHCCAMHWIALLIIDIFVQCNWIALLMISMVVQCIGISMLMICLVIKA